MVHHRPAASDFDPADLIHPDSPTPARPHVLIVGDIGSGFQFYGPTGEIGDPNLHARVLLLDEVGANYSIDPLMPLSALATIDGEPDEPDPAEAKRTEFLRLAAKARELTAEADRPREPGENPIDRILAREQAESLTAQALALAEELLA
jgi:hypothetical protein